MICLRLAFGAIAAMAVATALTGGLAVIDYRGRGALATPPLELTAGDRSPYWQALVEGARAAARAGRVPLTVTWPDAGDRSEAIPPSASGSNWPVQRLGRLVGPYPQGPDTVLVAQMGTFATEISDDAPDDDAKYLFRVGMAYYSAGRNCAALVREFVPRGGTVIALVDSSPSSEAAIGLNGLREELLRCNPGDAAVNLVVHQAGAGSSTTGRDLVGKARRYEAQLVVDLTGQPVGQVLAFLETLPPETRPAVITFDSSERTLAAIEAEEVHALVTTDPFQCGYQAVSRMALLQRCNPCELPVDGRGSILLPSQVVRREDVAEFRDRLHIGAQTP